MAPVWLNLSAFWVVDMSVGLCARMPRSGPAASSSPCSARLPGDVLMAPPVRLSIASLAAWLNPAASWPVLKRWPIPRGALCVRAGRHHVAERQTVFGCFWAAHGAPPAASGALQGAREARPRFIPKKL